MSCKLMCRLLRNYKDNVCNLHPAAPQGQSSQDLNESGLTLPATEQLVMDGL